MGKKKETAARGSDPVEGDVTVQSAAERRSVEAQLQALIDKFASAHSQQLGKVRKWLNKRLPTAYEVVYEYRDFLVISYSPNEHGYDGVLGLRASAEGVKLYFNGAKQLPDPEKLLKGSGGQARWIDLVDASPLALPAVLSLVDAAIARSRVAFASSGRGPMVMSPSSAKKVPKSSTSKKKD